MAVLAHSTISSLYPTIAVFPTMIILDGVMVSNLKPWLNYFVVDSELIPDMWGIMPVLLALLISLSVIFFSYSYTSGLVVNHSMLYYPLLVTCTVLLILSNSSYWSMLGWDGLGAASSCLIVYYSNNTSINNGISTSFQNRIGDSFLIPVVCSLLNVIMESTTIYGILVPFLIPGACVKSAQFPFNSWSLAAMSAPTPISSLVHSSTLVVAGVYVIMRFGYCTTDYSDVSKWISIVSPPPSGVGLLSELDMKKLIAHSTMSHTSLMLFMSSMGINKVASSHSNIHAMFKSMIFIGFGLATPPSSHSQDSRIISYLFINPVIKISFLFPGPCPPGLPSLSGLYSKDSTTEAVVGMEGGVIQCFTSLSFLGMSVHYGAKLTAPISSNGATGHSSSSHFGLSSLVFSAVLMLLMVNTHTTMVSGVSPGVFNHKYLVYFIILVHMLISWSKLSSLTIFSSMLSALLKDMMGSSWLVNFSVSDTKSFVMMNNMASSSGVKSSLMKKSSLVNWWVVMVFVVVVHNQSLTVWFWSNQV